MPLSRRAQEIFVQDAVRLRQHIRLSRRARILTQNEKRLTKQAAARAFHTYDPFFRAFQLHTDTPSLFSCILRHARTTLCRGVKKKRGKPPESKLPKVSSLKALPQRKLPEKYQNPTAKAVGLFGAAIRIRTGDLMLTKHVLYQLSYSSNFERAIALTTRL